MSPVMGRQVDNGRHLRRSEIGPLRPFSERLPDGRAGSAWTATTEESLPQNA